VFLLDIYGKGDKSTLTQAEKNALAKLLPKVSAAYRESSRVGSEQHKEGLEK
jgi:hypothetical protein